MNQASRQTRLQLAIEHYSATADDPTEQQARDVISRISSSKQATSAFEKFRASPSGGARILTACVEADELTRTYHVRVRDEAAMLSRLVTLKGAANDLLSFVNETYCHSPDRLSATISDDVDTVSAMKRGVGLILQLIIVRERLARETPLRLGATRKKGETAGETAAIGWLAEAVRHVCKTPHTEATADIAQAVLRCEVSADRVKEAERTRLERDWREQ